MDTWLQQRHPGRKGGRYKQLLETHLKLAVITAILTVTTAQPGFISIDCGQVSQNVSYVSSTRILYSGDQFYSGGRTAFIFREDLPGVSLEQTLRIFPSGTKGCYSVPVPSPGRYLVRPLIWYGNWDNQQVEPSYGVALGPTLLYTRNGTATGFEIKFNLVDTEEVIVPVRAGETIDYCHTRVSGDPVINALDIRPVADAFTTNQTEGKLVQLWYPGAATRLLCGGGDFAEGSIWRYAQGDVLDRKWIADEGPGAAFFNSLFVKRFTTKAKISGAMVRPRMTPQFVFQGMRTTDNAPGRGESLSYSLPVYGGRKETWWFLLHFAELDPKVKAVGDRVFDIYFSDELVHKGMDIFAAAGGWGRAFTLEIYHVFPVDAALVTLELRATKTSRLPDAAISGIEYYQLVERAPGTVPGDVAAIGSIKKAVFAAAGSPSPSFTSWAADPCAPVVSDFLGCSNFTNGSHSVTSLRFSGLNLPGSIPAELFQLSNLQEMWLDSNAFTGEVPDMFDRLPNLEVLCLASNKLTGQLPPSLEKLKSLRVLNISLNNFQGEVPGWMLEKPGLEFIHDGNALCQSTSSSPNEAGGLPACTNTTRPAAGAGGGGGGFPIGAIIGIVVAAVMIVLVGVGVVVLLCNLGIGHSGDTSLPFMRTRPDSIIKKEEERVGSAHRDSSIIMDHERGGKGSRRQSRKSRLSPVRDGSSGSREIDGTVLRYPFAELEDATAGWSGANVIGSGGFGLVYRGLFRDGMVVAVKRRAVGSLQGRVEFQNEVDLLKHVRFHYLVSLLGYCDEAGQQILVYDYMSNGSLREHLYDDRGAPRGSLTWKSRLSIALQAARGIEYLHIGTRPSIIHRDIKTSNILLTSDWEARVADFGMSRIGPVGDATHVSTIVKGTAGYLDPEYYSVQHLSEKSDVYSFGVVLLELITGQEPINHDRPRPQWSLVEWVRWEMQVGSLMNIVDPTMGQDWNPEVVWRVGALAISCLEPLSTNRPSISEVALALVCAMEDEGMAPLTRYPLPIFEDEDQDEDCIDVGDSEEEEDEGNVAPLPPPLLAPPPSRQASVDK